MEDNEYSIQLAREILENKEITETRDIPILSEDKRFIKYEDDYIEIIGGKTTKALHIEIYKPLTDASSNPIIYVDDNGECFRNHGERTFFIMYAEKLLNKPNLQKKYEGTLFEKELQEKQKMIHALIK